MHCIYIAYIYIYIVWHIHCKFACKACNLQESKEYIVYMCVG